MEEKPPEKHNGHRQERTGAERPRSGFDRRRNWGDSSENDDRRIGHRFSERVREGGLDPPNPWPDRAPGARPAVLGAACFLAGLWLGIWVHRRFYE